jgi:dephospho-CoA kinase
VIVVGLTGGIGSGKSTVSGRLVERGAILIDADAVTRELQEPGEPVFDAMVARFGEGIVGADGCLDRAAVAAMVFGDDDALRDLNAIVHPAVRERIQARLAELDPGQDQVVVLDIPLLAEGRHGERARRYPIDGVVVVDTPVEVAVARLIRHRGFTEADARARLARQASRVERVALADIVVDNSGSPEELDRQMDRVWTWIGRMDRDAHRG